MKSKMRNSFKLMAGVLFAMLFAFILGGTSLKAKAANYDLYIYGRQVTDENASNIWAGSLFADGAFSYNPSTNTLTIKNGFLGSDDSIFMIKAGEHLPENFVINVDGDFKVIGVSSFIQLQCKSAILQGSGTIEFQQNAANYPYLRIGQMYNNSLTVKDLTIKKVNFVGGGSAVYRCNITFDNVNIEACGNSDAISGYGGTIAFNNCGITYPVGAQVKSSVLEPDSNVVAKSVIIEKAVNYGVNVMGTPVTSLNAEDVFAGDPNYAGVFSYDADSCTLNVLKDVSISASESPIFDVKIAYTGLTIKLDAVMNVSGDTSILATNSQKVMITGGQINYSGTKNYPIGVQYGNGLTLKNTVLDGVSLSGNGHSTYLRIDGCTIFAPSGIVNFNSGITLENCMISEPEGAVVGNSKILCRDNTTPASNLRIVCKNGLVVEGDQINYYKNGVIDTEFFGFVEFEGSKFLVANGCVVKSAQGLKQDPQNGDDWYFCANGQVQMQKSGLVQYPAKSTNWFYVQDGKLDTTYNGKVSYNGGEFFVARGKILTTKSGLFQDPNNKADWYFLANGQVQLKKTGIAKYNGAAFYVINGRLASDYTGTVEEKGVKYKVVNGRAK